MFNRLENHLQRRREKRIAALRAEYPERVSGIEKAMINGSVIDEDERDEHILDMGFKRVVSYTASIALSGLVTIVSGLSAAGLYYNNQTFNSKHAISTLIAAVSGAVLAYSIKKSSDYDKRRESLIETYNEISLRNRR